MDLIKLKQSIKKHEGLRLKPYRCTANKLTIGYGRNIEDVGITEQEAEVILTNDITKLTNQLPLKIPFFNTLDDARQNVLIEMAFNLGIDGLLKFKNTLALVEAKKYDEASKGMLNSLWAKQVGQRAITLSNIMKGGF